MAFKTPLFFDAYLAGGSNATSSSKSYTGIGLNLHDHIVTNASATYFVKSDTDALRKAGINKDDLLVVNRSLTPCSGDAVIAVIDNEFLLTRYVSTKDQKWLEREEHNSMSGYRKYLLDEESEAFIWGVVTYSIHKLKEEEQSR